MKYHVLTAIIFAVALGLYSLGFGAGALGVALLGGVFELWFWIRLFRGRPSEDPAL